MVNLSSNVIWMSHAGSEQEVVWNGRLKREIFWYGTTWPALLNQQPDASLGIASATIRSAPLQHSSRDFCQNSRSETAAWVPRSWVNKAKSFGMLDNGPCACVVMSRSARADTTECPLDELTMRCLQNQCWQTWTGHGWIATLWSCWRTYWLDRGEWPGLFAVVARIAMLHSQRHTE